MSKRALVSELQAVGVSVETAMSAAENEDWSLSEQALLDAQERGARVLRELGLIRGEAGDEMPVPMQPPLPAREE